MFLLVPAHPGFPGQIPQSRKTVVCVIVPAKCDRVQCVLCIVAAVTKTKLCVKQGEAQYATVDTVSFLSDSQTTL